MSSCSKELRSGGFWSVDINCALNIAQCIKVMSLESAYVLPKDEEETLKETKSDRMEMEVHILSLLEERGLTLG